MTELFKKYKIFEYNQETLRMVTNMTKWYIPEQCLCDKIRDVDLVKLYICIGFIGKEILNLMVH